MLARSLPLLVLLSVASIALDARPAFAAGDVSARLRRGRLDIRGDNAANALEIAQVGPSTFEVRGLSGTTVNGGALARFDLPGRIRVRTEGGDDTVVVVGPDTKDLKIDTGDGNDRVELRTVFVDGELRISTGGGADTVTLQSSDVFRRTRIVTGPGRDRVEFLQTAIQGKAVVKTGADEDEVLLDGTYGGSQIDVRTGGGPDRLTVTNVSLRRLKGNGGGDRDQAIDGGGNTFSRPARLRNFEVGSL